MMKKKKKRKKIKEKWVYHSNICAVNSKMSGPQTQYLCGFPGFYAQISKILLINS